MMSTDDRHSRAAQDAAEAREQEKWDRLADERELAGAPLSGTVINSARTLAGRTASLASKARILSAISDPYALTHAELARIVASAVRRHPNVRKSSLSEYERDALTQDVTVSLLPGQRHGRPSDVLAWIDYAMAHPVSAARAERIPRGTVGRTLIETRIGRMLHESRAWRDTVETYRVKDRASRETERALVAQVIAADFAEPSDDDAMSASYRALVAESIARGDIAAPVSLDVSELAESIARGYGTREREQVRAAIVRVCADDPTVALAQLAQLRGKSLGAVRVEASKGAAILRKMDLRDVIALVEASRDERPELDTERMLRNLPAAWGYLAPHHPAAPERTDDGAEHPITEPESIETVAREYRAPGHPTVKLAPRMSPPALIERDEPSDATRAALIETLAWRGEDRLSDFTERSGWGRVENRVTLGR